MTPERFSELYWELETQASETMDVKRQDYASDTDRLQNFREIAEFENRSMSEVAMSNFLKHVQSLRVATSNGNYDWCYYKEGGGEGIKQRLVDAHNYVVLLMACMEEEQNEL